MKYLLDVTAILAWRHSRSPHYDRFHTWATRVGRTNLLTCAHAELGFIRISMHAFGYTLTEAQEAVAIIKQEAGGFVETAPSPRLPDWATTSARTSDAYLVQVARANSLRLATLDRGIQDETVHVID